MTIVLGVRAGSIHGHGVSDDFGELASAAQREIRMARRRAAVMGVVFILAGVVPVLGGLGIVDLHPTEGTPGWMGVCAGLAFILAGLAVINGYAIARGVGPNGNLAPDTPFLIILMQHLLGLGIMLLMTTMTGWIAFGQGARHFSMTIALPFIAGASQSGELSGRIAFGVATVLLVAMTLVLGWTGVRRLRRAWPKRGS